MACVIRARILALQTLPQATLSAQNTLLIHQNNPEYTSSRFASRSAKKPSKLWFSRTYSPKYSWVKVKPDPEEIDTNIVTENQEFLQAQEKKLLKESPLIYDAPERNPWRTGTCRTGALGIKIGVVPQWTNHGQKTLCTMIQVLDNHIISYRPPEEFDKMMTIPEKMRGKGFGMVVVGALTSSPYEFTGEYNKLFEIAGLPPKRMLTRFYVTPDAKLAPGTPLSAQHFRVGDFVDTHARTIEMGFQGVCMRWGMKGGRATHGVTKAHRRIGSIGGGGDKGGIWRGKKLPGHMGSVWRFVRGLEIMRINTEYNVIYVKGIIPGPPHAYVRIMDTILPNKRMLLRHNPPPMPTFLPEDQTPETPKDFHHEKLHKFDSPSISYEGVDTDKLHLYSKKYILYGGTFDGVNVTRRRKLNK